MSGGFHRDNRGITEDDENRDANGAHQPLIVGVGWRQDVKGVQAGLQSGFGQELEHLG